MHSIKKKSSDPDVQMVLDELHDLKDAFKIMSDKVLQLPCAVHVEKFKIYDDHVKRHNDMGWALFLCFIGFVTVLVTMGTAWGSLKSRVDEHHRTAEKVFDICCPGVLKL